MYHKFSFSMQLGFDDFLLIFDSTLFFISTTKRCFPLNCCTVWYFISVVLWWHSLLWFLKRNMTPKLILIFKHFHRNIYIYLSVHKYMVAYVYVRKWSIHFIYQKNVMKINDNVKKKFISSFRISFSPMNLLKHEMRHTKKGFNFVINFSNIFMWAHKLFLL